MPEPEPQPSPTPTPAPTPSPTPEPAAAAPAAPTPVIAAEIPPATWADLKLPEGVKTDDPLNTKFLEVVNDTKLTSKDRAQALIDLQTGMATAAAEKRSVEWNAIQDGWVEQTKKDPELGGPKFEANQTLVNKLVTQFGSPALNQALELTGAANHPEMFRFLLKLAPLVLEAGGTPPGATPAPANDEAAALERRYPSMKAS